MKYSLFFILSFLTCFKASFSKEITFPPNVQRSIESVCIYCHYQDFFEEQTGAFLPEKFVAKADEISRRVSLPHTDPDIMPPKTSPIQLDEEVRLEFVEALKPYLKKRP